MAKRIAGFIFVLCLLVPLAGCPAGEEQQNQFLEIRPTQNEIQGELDSKVETTQPAQPAEISFAYSARTAPHALRSGKLEFTISNPRAVTNRKDMPGGDFEGAYAGIWENGKVTEYVCYSKRFPSFVLEDGSFVKGVQLVLVDVTVTNRDAVALTREDADVDGKGGGSYDDPYVFRADSLFSFTDTDISTGAISVLGSHAGNSGDYAQKNMTFFSRLDTCKEHSFAFRLEPGNTISYTVGIVFGNSKDGTPKDLSTIAARICNAQLIGGDAADCYIVSLGLGGNQDA